MVQYLAAWMNLHFGTEEEGQGLVEYALILVLIAVVCVAALGLLGGRVNEIFGEITDGLG